MCQTVTNIVEKNSMQYICTDTENIYLINNNINNIIMRVARNGKDKKKEKTVRRVCIRDDNNLFDKRNEIF